MFPEIRKSMSSEYFETLSPRNLNLSPRVAKQYEQIEKFIHNASPDRIGEFSNFKLEKVEVNPKKIELWIGTALKEALKEGYIVKKAVDPKASILKVFGIDKETLKANELDSDAINRLYRALYVYSLGFHELIKEPLERSVNRHKTLTSVWKVYSILLQYVCKTEYSMVVAKLTKAYQLDVVRLEEIIETNKEEYERQRDILETRISNLEDENMSLGSELDNFKTK
jgi:hypothetical protein